MRGYIYTTEKEVLGQVRTYNTNNHNSAFCIAFLRSGEFTSVAGCTLSVLDVSIDSRSNPQILSICLRRSKTDQFAKGTYIHLGRTNDTICPVSAGLGYLAIRPQTQGPFFIFQDGTPLSRQQLIKHPLYPRQTYVPLVSPATAWCGNYSSNNGYE